MRSLLKRGIERLAVGSGLVRRRLRADSPSLMVLAYHNVRPRGEPAVGEAGLHIEQSRFADHLDAMSESHEVVSLARALRDSEMPDQGRPRAVITFDDGYLGTMTVGLQELARRGFPATVFVPPGLLGGAGFWWDRVADPTDGVIPPALRDHLLTALQGRQERVLEWAETEGVACQVLPDWACPVGASSLGSLLAEAPDVSIASHTWSHPNLAALSADAALAEVERGRAWLSTLEGVSTVDALAYPYGLCSEFMGQELGARGLGAAFLVEGGLAMRRGRWLASSMMLPRVSIPAGLSTDGLRLRLAGLR